MRYREPMLLHLGFGLVFWFLWGVQRGVGVVRFVEAAKRPPTCEFCGYNLTAMPLEGRCPECGRGVVESLGAGARPGTAFQRHRGAGRWRAWRRCCTDVISRPSAIGRELRLGHSGAAHRSYFLWYLPLFFGASVAGVLACFVADGGWESSLRRADEFLFAGTILGYGGMIAATALTLLGALVVGFTVGRDAGRNVLVASRRIATYLGGFLVLWILYAWTSGAVVISMVRYHVFEPLERLTTLTEGGMAFLLWSLPNIVLLMVYFALLGRGTTAARFANQ